MGVVTASETWCMKLCFLLNVLTAEPGYELELVTTVADGNKLPESGGTVPQPVSSDSTEAILEEE